MAQTLAKVGAVVGSEVVLPCLKRLLTDADMDVRFYAAESIETLKNPAVASAATHMDTHATSSGEGGAATLETEVPS